MPELNIRCVVTADTDTLALAQGLTWLVKAGVRIFGETHQSIGDVHHTTTSLLNADRPDKPPNGADPVAQYEALKAADAAQQTPRAGRPGRKTTAERAAAIDQAIGEVQPSVQQDPPPPPVPPVQQPAQQQAPPSVSGGFAPPSYQAPSFAPQIPAAAPIVPGAQGAVVVQPTPPAMPAAAAMSPADVPQGTEMPFSDFQAYAVEIQKKKPGAQFQFLRRRAWNDGTEKPSWMTIDQVPAPLRLRVCTELDAVLGA